MLLPYHDDEYVRRKMREVGFLIAYHRRQKGLSQAKLADAAGISRQHLAAVEASSMQRPFSVEFLIKIAAVLEISPAELFEYDKKE